MALNTKIRGLQINDAFFGSGFQRNAGDGNIAELDLKASGGLKIDTGEVAVEPTDFAGVGLEDDGSDNLRVKLDGATLAVGAGGLKVSSIANAEIAADADIALDKLHDMADTKVMIGSGAGNAEYALSGDVTMSNAGVTAIGNTKVTDAMLNDDVATGLAGVGISSSAGVLALDINELPVEATFDPAADYCALEDATDNGSNKTLWSVIATAIAGSGITATDGVLSADAVAGAVLESDIQVENESANCNGATTDFTLSNTPLAASIQVFLNGLMQEDGSGKDYTVAGTTVSFVTAPETNDILIIHYIIDNA